MLLGLLGRTHPWETLALEPSSSAWQEVWARRPPCRERCLLQSHRRPPIGWGRASAAAPPPQDREPHPASCPHEHHFGSCRAKVKAHHLDWESPPENALFTGAVALYPGGSVPQGRSGHSWRSLWSSQLGTEEMPLASSGWGPGMLLNILQCPGHPHSMEWSSPKRQECRG